MVPSVQSSKLTIESYSQKNEATLDCGIGIGDAAAKDANGAKRTIQMEGEDSGGHFDVSASSLAQSGAKLWLTKNVSNFFERGRCH